MLISLLKHYLDTDTALKVSPSVYCFTTSISYGVENYFPRLWGMGISDAIFTIGKEVFSQIVTMEQPYRLYLHKESLHRSKEKSLSWGNKSFQYVLRIEKTKIVSVSINNLFVQRLKFTSCEIDYLITDARFLETRMLLGISDNSDVILISY